MSTVVASNNTQEQYSTPRQGEIFTKYNELNGQNSQIGFTLAKTSKLGRWAQLVTQIKASYQEIEGVKGSLLLEQVQKIQDYVQRFSEFDPSSFSESIKELKELKEKIVTAIGVHSHDPISKEAELTLQKLNPEVFQRINDLYKQMVINGKKLKERSETVENRIKAAEDTNGAQKLLYSMQYRAINGTTPWIHRSFDPATTKEKLSALITNLQEKEKSQEEGSSVAEDPKTANVKNAEAEKTEANTPKKEESQENHEATKIKTIQEIYEQANQSIQNKFKKIEGTAKSIEDLRRRIERQNMLKEDSEYSADTSQNYKGYKKSLDTLEQQVSNARDLLKETQEALEEMEYSPLDQKTERLIQGLSEECFAQFKQSEDEAKNNIQTIKNSSRKINATIIQMNNGIEACTKQLETLNPESKKGWFSL